MYIKQILDVLILSNSCKSSIGIYLLPSSFLPALLPPVPSTVVYTRSPSTAQLERSMVRGYHDSVKMIVIQLWFTNLDSPESLRDCLHQLILYLLGDGRSALTMIWVDGSLVSWTVSPYSFPIINHQPRPNID